MGWTSLISTVTGAVIAVVAGLVSDSSRRKRDVSAQWRDRRYETYRDFLTAMHEESSAAHALASTRGLLQGPVPIDPEEGVHLIAEADRRLIPVYETIQMLGSRAVGAAAHDWRLAMWQLTDMATGTARADASGWEDAYVAYRLGRDGFRAAVRDELRIPDEAFRRPSGPSTRPPHHLVRARSLPHGTEASNAAASASEAGLPQAGA
jgi:hypothetical protein